MVPRWRRPLFPEDFPDGVLGVASTQLSNLFIGPAHMAAFGVLTSVPIFTVGGIAGQVKQAQAQRERALLSTVILIVLRDVEDALIALQKGGRTTRNGQPPRRRITRIWKWRRRYEEGYIEEGESLPS
jgi:multidrug efflux system outer membrane protein